MSASDEKIHNYYCGHLGVHCVCPSEDVETVVFNATSGVNFTPSGPLPDPGPTNERVDSCEQARARLELAEDEYRTNVRNQFGFQVNAEKLRLLRKQQDERRVLALRQ
jgi:hypothetical protein